MAHRLFEGKEHAEAYLRFRVSPSDHLIQQLVDFVEKKTLRGSWQAYMRCLEPFAKLTFASTRESATGFDEKHRSGAMSTMNQDWAVSLAWNISHSYDSGSERLTHSPDGPSKTPEFAKSRLMTPAARKRTL
ncbi:unnamed protein product [Arctogadus glacialis]